MKKLMLAGRVGAGKTTLTQALKHEDINYRKTQYIGYEDWLIDTPGEYLENACLASALALYSYEADVVGILMASNEPFSLYPPNCVCHVNRDVIGIVTKMHDEEGNVERAERWLRLTGCKKIFVVDSVTGEGVEDIIKYLSEPTKNTEETTKN
jgi:ethanolamine utilization protein EutP